MSALCIFPHFSFLSYTRSVRERDFSNFGCTNQSEDPVADEAVRKLLDVVPVLSQVRVQVGSDVVLLLLRSC